MQKEVRCKVTFYGLREVVHTISSGRLNIFRGRLTIFLGSNPVLQYKLTRPVYTSKVLVGLLKQEYEVRTFTSSPTSLIVNPRVFADLSKLYP